MQTEVTAITFVLIAVYFLAECAAIDWGDCPNAIGCQHALAEASARIARWDVCGNRRNLV